MVFQYNPNMLPDQLFSPGELSHLVVGNEGRAIDKRRTPLLLKEVLLDIGYAIFEIMDFEDKGNTWEIPFEDIVGVQFKQGSARLSGLELEKVQDVANQFDQLTHILCSEEEKQKTFRLLEKAKDEVQNWLKNNSQFLASHKVIDFSSKEGVTELYQDLGNYMDELGLRDIDTMFSSHYVCKFFNSEFVKCHRVVVAKMGLVPYHGKVVRDPNQLKGDFSEDRRRDHIINRMAFTHSIYRLAGHGSVLLYRGLHTDGLPQPMRNNTFVSCATNIEICKALACFDETGKGAKNNLNTGVLFSQQVPIDRIFMSYMETPEMNEPYNETEFVLLFKEGAAF